MAGDPARASRPPYAPVKGMRDFFELAKGKSAPLKIDRDYLSGMGVALGNEQHLLATLKFLGLVDEAGRPGRYFSTLSMRGPDRRRGLQNMVREAYASLFTGEIDLSRATRAEVHDHFVRRYGVQGQMARKATALFALMCSLAEIPISSDLGSSDSARDTRGKKRRATGGSVPVELPSQSASRLGFPVVIALTPELSLDEIVAFLRRVKQAVSIVSGDD